MERFFILNGHKHFRLKPIFIILIVGLCSCTKKIQEFEGAGLGNLVTESVPVVTQTSETVSSARHPLVITYGGQCETGLPVLISGDLLATTPCTSGTWEFVAAKATPGDLNLVFSQTNSGGTGSATTQYEVEPLLDRFYAPGVASAMSSTYDPANDPSYSSNILKLTSNGSLFCALFSTGKVNCWGVGMGPATPPRVPPGVPSTGFIDISSSRWFQHGIQANGDIWRWTNSETFGVNSVQVNIPSAMKIVSTAWGQSFCVLTSTQQVLCSGENNTGLLGDGTTTDAVGSTVQPVGLDSGVLGIETAPEGNENFFCALKTGGAIYCWGQFDGVVFGSTPQLILTDADVVEISVSNNEGICVRRSSGTVACRGSAFGDANSFTEMTGLPEPIASIKGCGGAYGQTCGFTSTGKAYLIAPSGTTVLGPFSAGVSAYYKIQISGIGSLGIGAHCFLHRNQVKCSGENGNSGLGNSELSTYAYNEANAVSYTFNQSIIGLRATYADQGGCALDSNKDLWCWGKNFPGITPSGVGATSTPQRVFTGVDQIVPYSLFPTDSIDVIKDGALYTGGASGFSIVEPAYGANVVKAVDGPMNKCVLFTDGSVKCSNSADAQTAGVAVCAGGNCAAPQTPTGLEANVTDISTSYHLHCAIKSSELWCWGWMHATEPLPFKMTNFPSDLTAVFAGYQRVCAYSLSSGFVCGLDPLATADVIPNSIGADLTSVQMLYNLFYRNAGVIYMDGSVTTGAVWDRLYVTGFTIGTKFCKIVGATITCHGANDPSGVSQAWMPGLAWPPYLVAIDPVPAHLVD